MTEQTRTSPRGPLARWERRVAALVVADSPAYLNLRKALRATIVVPGMLAFGTLVLHNDSVALYAVFASFVALVLSDYGGPPRARALAYLTSVALGSAAIVLGAALSSAPVAAVIAMFVTAFAATFVTAYGGNRALHVAPVALAFSLSVLDPLSQLAVRDRVGGWAMGGTAALVAALFLWPTETRSGLRRAMADVASALADALGSLGHQDRARGLLAAARHDVSVMQERFSTPLRPYGPVARDVAMVHLVEHLKQGVELVGDVVDGQPGGADPELTSAIARSLERCGAVLRSQSRPSAGDQRLASLDEARTAARLRAVTAAAHEASTGGRPYPALRAEIPLLALSHLVLWIEYEADQVMGVGVADSSGLTSAPEMATAYRSPDARTAVRRARRFAASELDPDGVILRNSIRAGAALALAVLAAEVLPVAHGFWIVLAALSVLRSGASSTYATAFQAIVGTVIGMAIAVPVVLAAGNSTLGLWLLYPVAVLLAAYTPGAIDFAVGQAAFMLLVVLLFSLLDLPGIDTAVVRVETVSVGSISATVLSLIIWPRGARAALTRSLAGVYRAAAAEARVLISGSASARATAAADLSGAGRRAEAAFASALSEHSEPINATAWVAVFQPPLLARALLAGLVPVVRPSPACSDAAAAVQQAAVDVAAQLLDVAAHLDGTVPDLTERAAEPTGNAAVAFERCLSASAHSTDAMLDVLALVAWSELIGRLATAIRAARPALEAVR